MAHVRTFDGRKYKLWNVYFTAPQIQGRLKQDKEWAKGHGYLYRTTTLREMDPNTKRVVSGKALWLAPKN